jgi:response regulator RpfG family c-di-GMP phosphodiesterase
MTENDTPQNFSHTVLIVDDDEKIGRCAGAALKKMGVKYVYTATGKEGLQWIKTASSPFSMILSDQRTGDMEGADFLARAKDAAPDTLRYLIAGNADIHAVTRAVNRGSIHRYIAKPWIEREFMEVLDRGLKLYELTMENHRLFALAKAQNEKLYQLNMDLKQNSEKFKRSLALREKEIDRLNRILEKGFENRSHVNEIEVLLEEKHMMEAQKADILCRAVISELFEQFRDIASRHGFEMIDTSQGGIK